MCRILAAWCGEKIKVSESPIYGNPSFSDLSSKPWDYGGKSIGPQSDGWGVAWLEEDGFKLFRSTRPFHESACAAELLEQLETRMFVSHLRKVSRIFSFSKSLLNTQPFSDGRLAFVHNGTVACLRNKGEREGKSDSRLLYEEFLEFRRIPDFLRHVVEKYSSCSSALNIVVSDGREIYALNLFSGGERWREAYYTMYYQKVGTCIFVASQPMNGGSWSPIGNEKVLRISSSGEIEVIQFESL